MKSRAKGSGARSFGALVLGAALAAACSTIYNPKVAYFGKGGYYQRDLDYRLRYLPSTQRLMPEDWTLDNMYVGASGALVPPRRPMSTSSGSASTPTATANTKTRSSSSRTTSSSSTSAPMPRSG